MATPIRIKRSAVPGKRPTLSDLQLGELAINTYDGRIYLKKDIGISTSIVLVTPWTENIDGSIYYNNGNVGIGTTDPTSKFTVVGNVNITGVLSASSYSGNITSADYAVLAGVATYATSAGIATYATSAGIATYATSAGIATYASNAGVATYATSAGIATYATTAGIATYATSAGIATYASNAGVATYASNAGVATYSSISGIATYATTAGIATYATVAGIATYATSAGVATYSSSSGIATYATSAGISSVAGIATYATTAGIATYATSAGIATYATSAGIATYSSTAGIATYATTAGIATYASTAGIATYATTAGISSVAGIATYATTAGIATYATIAGIATYASNAGVATYASTAGISTYATTAGITTYASIAGIVTYADTAGIATYASNAGIATYATVSGVSTYATTAGIATYASIAGIVSYSQISGIATYAESAGIATYASTAGIATYASTAGIATYASTAGIVTYSIISGVSTSVIGGIGSVTQLQVTGISTFTNGPVLIGSGTSTGTASQRLQTTGGAYISGNVGIGTTNPKVSLDVVGNSKFTGIVTATAFVGQINAGFGTITNLNSNFAYILGLTTSVDGFVGNLTGTATTAVKLKDPRTFEITGDIVASPVSFDGTGNVSLAATIQPNSIGLGTDTFGDYVENISGTANQITVTGGTGERSNPIISFSPNPTIPGNVTIGNDLQVNNNLNVTGNITVGGTEGYILVENFRVSDADIVLGFTTDSQNNEVSTDTTANHGGIAIASTEGNPLVNLNIAGIETLPATYKKIMWFKAGAFAGLNTDAWLSNYAIGIGSTQFPSGTRLAAGSVQFTENDLSVVRNINSSGIITTSTGNITTLNSTNANIVTGLVTSISGTNLNYTGISTVNVLRASTFNVSGVSTFVGVGTFSSDLYVGGNLFISNDLTLDELTSRNINVTGIGTIATLNSTTGNITTLNSTNANIVTGIVTNLSGTNINYTGVSTFTNGPVLIGSGTSTGTASQRLQATGGAYISGNVGIGTTLPRSTYKLDIIGDINFDGNLFQNNTRFVSGIGIGSTSVNPGSGIISRRIGVGFTDINIVGTGLSITGYGSTVVIDFGNLGGALSISTSVTSVAQDLTFVGGATTSVIGIATITDRLVYVPSTGRVGVGTSTPAFKLDVVGDINSSTALKVGGVNILDEALRLSIAFG